MRGSSKVNHSHWAYRRVSILPGRAGCFPSPARAVWCTDGGENSITADMDGLKWPSTETLGEAGVFFNIDLSRDEKRLAVSRLTQQPGAQAEFDIWVLDVATGRMTRLTDDPAWEFDPSWSPDGTRIVFNSNRPDPGTSRWALFTRASDGSGADTPLARADDANLVAADWSATNVIAYNYTSGDSSDLWLRASDREGRAGAISQHQD